MYLVEIEAGREQLYESVEALAAAIRSGAIGPESRIFHRASSNWISITHHPEYRKALPHHPVEPLAPLSRNRWTFFGTEVPARQIIESEEEAAAKQPERPPQPAPPRGFRSLLGRMRRQLSAAPEAPEQPGS